MTKTNLFLIDGEPMLVPDADMEFSSEDLDSSDSGRDESGYMHRIMIRCKVGTWSFNYSRLSQTELDYMETLFAGKAIFNFTFPDAANGGAPKTVQAYRSKYGIAWHSAKTGDYRNYKFNVIEC